MTTKLALVLGATGGIGGQVADRLHREGWGVRALYRPASKGARNPRFEWISGDAINAADVAAAAEGVSLIIHAVNPPGYRDWSKLVLPMLDNTIAAARTSDALVVLPGTVYNYGVETFPSIDETAPQQPRTRKGAIRVEMERRLRAAAEAGDIRALIVRSGDFFGPGAANNWFSQGLIAPGKRPTVIRSPGKRGVGHQWAYLPDVAETMVQLIERGTPDRFHTYHMEGHWHASGTIMTDAIVRVLGDPTISVAPLPWWMMRLASLFMATPREMMEMRYLWQHPVRLDDARLLATLGHEPRTPLIEAVRTTLASMDCLQETRDGRKQQPLRPAMAAQS